MIRKASECTVTVREQMKGGPGAVEQTECVFKEEMYNKARLFGKLVLKPGCGIGYHVHEGESELFYIMSGTVEYNDNGNIVTLTAGDTAVCTDGTGHGVTNNGTETAEMFAVIILK